jgi:hypothetical protein
MLVILRERRNRRISILLRQDDKYEKTFENRLIFTAERYHKNIGKEIESQF